MLLVLRYVRDIVHGVISVTFVVHLRDYIHMCAAIFWPKLTFWLILLLERIAATNIYS